MPNSLRPFSLAALLVVLSATRVDAQSEVAVIPGEPLRLEVVGPAGAPIGARCSGRVINAAQDTLIVASAGACKQGSYLASLQVIRGDRGSRTDHMAYLAMGGGVVGLVAGKLIGGTSYNKNGTVNRSKLWVGAGIGAAAGGVAGYMWPSGPQWVRVSTPRPLRVSSVNLRPGMEVSLARPETR